ncbi:F-actin-capping protein subunit alpha-1 [Perkinsus chesapeaki]|uniref:F-actin-capping protein subunit alpha n=1 Tax=Perkinsus chesapeaki TaxID=330153 RepID=A0A7J6LSW1_PERCH|nr:F-actin-capping protein subunit alpha-1 [Perkinsus chesapeaki]
MTSIDNKIIVSAPPGSLSKVLADLAVVLPDVENNRQEAIREYYERIGIAITSSAVEGDIVEILICPQARIGASDEYMDITGKKQCMIEWNEIPTIVKVGQVSTVPSDLEPLCELIREQYNKDGFNCGAWTRGNVIDIVKSRMALREQGLWSGCWHGAFAMTCDHESLTVEGSIKIQTHFWEDSNVQSTFTRSLPQTTIPKTSDLDYVAREVIKVITDFENKCHAAIDGLITTWAPAACKALRRRQPMNGMKFDWNVHRQTLSRDLTDNTSQLIDAKPDKWK